MAIKQIPKIKKVGNKSGWFNEMIRHRNAKLIGKAGGIYRGFVKKAKPFIAKTEKTIGKDIRIINKDIGKFEKAAGKELREAEKDIAKGAKAVENWAEKKAIPFIKKEAELEKKLIEEKVIPAAEKGAAIAGKTALAAGETAKEGYVGLGYYGEQAADLVTEGEVGRFLRSSKEEPREQLTEGDFNYHDDIKRRELNEDEEITFEEK